MDVLVSSNFERLLWFLSHEYASGAGMGEEVSSALSWAGRLWTTSPGLSTPALSVGPHRANLRLQWTKRQAGQEVTAWYKDLKTRGGFGPVYKDMLENGRVTFESERVTDPETLETIKKYYDTVNYVLDPHSAVGVTAAERSLARTGPGVLHVSLSTAHPAKFADAVKQALNHQPNFNFEETVLPKEFVGLEQQEKRVTTVANDWKAVRELINKHVADELAPENGA